MNEAPGREAGTTRLSLMEGWEWDPTLYGGSAPYYLRGRLPYAPHLAQAFVEALALDGTGRLIDIGTGPGVIAMDLAPYFEEVLGIDAAGLGSFRVATFAQSFHWIRRERVAEAVRHMLEPHVGRRYAVERLRVRASYPAIGGLAHRTLLGADRGDPAADLARTRAKVTASAVPDQPT